MRAQLYALRINLKFLRLAAIRQPRPSRAERMNTSFKIAAAGLLAALALIAFVLENLLPPLFIPGARLGLSNIFIMLAVFTLGCGYGYVALICKTVIGSVVTGNISAIIYSLPAGFVSLTLLICAAYFIKCSIIAASVLSSVVNITVQNTVFCLVTDAFEYFVYLPYLALIGIIAGAVTGFILLILLKKLPVTFTGLQETKKE